MGNNLSPDGTKIKALRIQRGWTQEQLAEIAGISTRTVQRAERANAAAFDTLRAIAGAFETDFDCLLRSEASGSPEPEPQAIPPISLPGIDSASAEFVAPGRPVVSARRARMMYLITASALAAGLAAGAHLTSRIYRKTASIQEIRLSNKAPISHKPALQESNRTGDSQNAETAPNAASKDMVQTASAGRKIGTKRNDAMFPGATKNAVATSPAPEPALHSAQHLILNPVDSELLPESPDILSKHPIPEIASLPIESPEPASDDAAAEQNAGAVRQALGQAAKKTGSFMSKVGTSLKRAF